MTDVHRGARTPLTYAGQPSSLGRGGEANLAELLERILDKGIVIAGDISISLVDVELLTIKLRLLIASVDKAREIGVNWWESDPWLSTRAAQQQLPQGPQKEHGQEEGLAERLDRIEAALQQLQAPADGRQTDKGSRR